MTNGKIRKGTCGENACMRRGWQLVITHRVQLPEGAIGIDVRERLQLPPKPGVDGRSGPILSVSQPHPTAGRCMLPASRAADAAGANCR